MATYQSQTIKKTIEDIESGKLIIPALQRNFVWPENKIADLFESLLRGYPIGTFLFWDVSPDSFNNYSFNKILTTLKESRNKKYRGEPADNGKSEYRAVLDGQQRITSLALGIVGKLFTHKKNFAWDQDSSYIAKYLCVNVLHMPIDSDDKYEIEFKTDDKINVLLSYDIDNNGTTEHINEFWVKISDIYSDDSIFNPATDGLFGFISSLEEMNETVFTRKARTFINNLLTNFRNVLTERDVVSIYTTPSNLPLDQVVDIFVRVNSGGQKLDDADLILSIASGENSEESFYDKISTAVEEIQNSTNTEFKCDKKFILSVSLLISGAESLSLKQPSNYSRPMINKIISDWDNIIGTIKSTLGFIEKLGFDVSKISSSLVIPIVYYFKLTARKANYFDQVSSRKDRVYIRQWLFRTIINGVFDDGTGKTLLRMRALIDESYNNGITHFPLEKFIEKAIKKPLLVSDEQIDDILDWKWPDARIRPLLMEISPSIPSGEYSLDHMWPRTYLNTKNKLKAKTPNKSDTERGEFKIRCDYLPNMQLLTSNENSQKNDQTFDAWLNTYYSDSVIKAALFNRNIIPDLPDYAFEEFITFFDARAKLITDRIKESFPDSVSTINERYGL